VNRGFYFLVIPQEIICRLERGATAHKQTHPGCYSNKLHFPVIQILGEMLETIFPPNLINIVKFTTSRNYCFIKVNGGFLPISPHPNESSQTHPALLMNFTLSEPFCPIAKRDLCV